MSPLRNGVFMKCPKCKTEIPIPNPGSDEAIELGCICPILDNAHGRGYLGQKNIFVHNCACQLHNTPEKVKTE